MLLQQLGQLQLEVEHLPVVLVQLCLEFKIFVVEAGVDGFGGVAALALDELAVHVDEWTVGEEPVGNLCQFAEVEPGLVDAVHQLGIGILLREVPRLHQVLEDKRHHLQQRLGVANQPHHVSHVGIDGQRADQLAILRGIPVQLNQDSVLLSVEVSSAIDEGEVVGEELVRLADE